MAKRQDIGKAGEDAAVAYLQRKGYEILDRNWRNGHLELDIVARNDRELVAVEVKTRHAYFRQLAQDTINATKAKRVRQAAVSYARQHDLNLALRLDFIMVTIEVDGRMSIYHAPNALHPALF